MKAFLCSCALVLFACGGADVSIGMNDSGGPPGSDGATSNQDSSSQQDTGGMNDANNPSDTSTGKDSDPNPGTDSGVCMPKIFNFGPCLNATCMLGEKQYCGPYPNMCLMTPQKCLCNYTCQCLLANIPNPCINNLMPKCTLGSNGGLFLSCN